MEKKRGRICAPLVPDYAGTTTLVVTFYTSSIGTLVVCSALAGRPSCHGKSTG